MQRLLAVLSLSEVGQTTVLHLLGSLYPTHRRVTAGLSEESWTETVLDLETEHGDAVEVSFYHGHTPTREPESERLQWDSGSGQHNIYELQHIDTAVLVCDGSLCRVCKADRCLLETAANELLSAGFRVLIALHNCHPELRSFDCTGLPACIPLVDVHMLPYSVFNVFPDRLDLTSELLKHALTADWSRVSTAVRALLCAAADLHPGVQEDLRRSFAANRTGLADIDSVAGHSLAPVPHTGDWKEVTAKTRPQPGSSAPAASYQNVTFSAPQLKGSVMYGIEPGSNKVFTVQADQVKDLGRVYGPAGKVVTEMGRLSNTVITLPPASARLPGKTVTIELASADAASNAQARNMIKAALKGLPWADIQAQK